MTQDIEVCMSCRAILTPQNSADQIYCTSCVQEFGLDDAGEEELPTYAQTGREVCVVDIPRTVESLRRCAVMTVRGDMYEARINPNAVDAMEAFSRLQLICGREPDLVAADYLNHLNVEEFENFKADWRDAKRCVAVK